MICISARLNVAEQAAEATKERPAHAVKGESDEDSPAAALPPSGTRRKSELRLSIAVHFLLLR